MPNIKSAKKRVLVNLKKNEENKAIRSAVKTEIKRVELLVKENKIEEATVALSKAFSAIDSACSKNIYHANNAANKKAKLAKKVSAAAKAAGVATEPIKEEVVAEEVVAEEVKPVEAKPAKKTTVKKTTTKKVDKE